MINPGARTPELSEVVGVLLGKEIAGQSFEIGEELPMELDFAAPNPEIDKRALQMQAQAILELYPLLLQKQIKPKQLNWQLNLKCRLQLL